jgi:hypothetical protein
MEVETEAETAFSVIGAVFSVIGAVFSVKRTEDSVFLWEGGITFLNGINGGGQTL